MIIRSNIVPMRASRWWRWGSPAAAALVGALLLAGCSGSSSPTPAATTTAAASAAPAVSAAAASAAVSSKAASTAMATPGAIKATKELVAGFPVKLVPVLKGAKVESSALQHSSPLSVVSLVETVAAKPADVLSFYSKVYLGQKFTALKGDQVDGTPTKTFVRSAGQENVTVSVVETAGTATVTVGATVFPASLK